MKRSFNSAFRYVPKPGIRFRSHETQAQQLARLQREQEDLQFINRIHQERRNRLRQQAGVRAVTKLQAAFRGRRVRNKNLRTRAFYAATKGYRLQRNKRWALSRQLIGL